LDHELQIERFVTIGLSTQDFKLAPLELVCACSLMLESKANYDLLRSLDMLRRESTEVLLDEAFFQQLDETIQDLEMSGLHDQARKLRKLGQEIVFMQHETNWQARWGDESDKRLTSAIKDEPFLPQRV
jgi:hypothetical protein